MKTILISITLCLLSILTNAQVHKYKAYEFGIYNKNSKQVDNSAADQLIILNLETQRLTIYTKNQITIDLVKYYKDPPPPEGEFRIHAQGVDNDGYDVEVDMNFKSDGNSNVSGTVILTLLKQGFWYGFKFTSLD